MVESGDAGSAKGNGSRFNAVKHGLTAKTAVLPGEDPEAFQAKVSIFKEGLDTRNEFEDELAKRAAMASWQLERANHSEVARLSRDILTGAEADVRREEEEVLALGNRLFFDRRGPIELYPSGEYTNSKQPRTSASGTADDPDDPAKIVLGLESTVAGCRWLLEAWKGLRDVLESGLAWQPHEKIKAIRLLGKQPLDAFSDRDVALVFIASHAIEPEYSHAFYELRCEIDEDSFKRHKARLGRWSRRGIAFADAAAAREALVLLVEKATERLRVIENQRKQVALKIGELRSDILSFDESKTGEQLRRHLGSCNRLLLRNVEAVGKLHRNQAQGWGRTRQERERRKQEEKPAGTQFDDRLVVDEQGTVRSVGEYIEAGLARYDAELGYGVPRARRPVVDEVAPTVPDYARWIADEERRKKENGGATEADPASAESGAGEVGDVPVMVVDEGEGANIQNEIGDVSLAVEADAGCAAERHGERSDAGASERVVVGVELATLVDVECAAERHGERSDAGASERGQSARISDSGDREICTRGRPRSSKRDRKRMRREMARRELERRGGEALGVGDAPVDDLVRDLARSSPSQAGIPGPHLPRSP